MKKFNIVSLLISLGIIIAFTVALAIFYPQYKEYRPNDYQPLNICYDNVKIIDNGNYTHSLYVDFHNYSQKEQTIKLVFYINEDDAFYREITLSGDSDAISTTYFYYTTYSSTSDVNQSNYVDIFFANENITGVNILDGEIIIERPTNGVDTLHEHLMKNATQLKKTYWLISGLSDNWTTSFDYNMLICWVMLAAGIVLTTISTISLVIAIRKKV